MAFDSEEKMHRPFEDLGNLFKRKKIALKRAPAPRPPLIAGSDLSPRQEAGLFREAVADVTPIAFNYHWRSPLHRPIYDSFPEDEEDRQTIEALDRLIDSGRGFVVAHTAEYMEATAPGVGAQIARQLHQGRYSVQDHVDLHGLSVQAAEVALQTFIHKAIRENKQAVLVIHGRGLTSPGRPVLKQCVYLWLTRGPLRKHVIAFTSARSCDGGAGATYVLLRRRPMTKRQRKAARRKTADAMRDR